MTKHQELVLAVQRLPLSTQRQLLGFWLNCASGIKSSIFFVTLKILNNWSNNRVELHQNRYTYLDNLRNFLVYNVVFFHIISIYAYPFMFWWPVIEKNRSSKGYESLILTMDIYLMPHLIFLSAFFIFLSLRSKSIIEYIKNRFMRLVIPLIVYIFCAGDIWHQILSKRLEVSNPTYFTTFFDYWRDFMNFSLITFIGKDKMLNQVWFNFHHTWFLSLLFVMSLSVVFLSMLFSQKEKVQIEVDNRKKIITKVFILSVILSFFYTVIAILYAANNINLFAFIRVLGLVQVRVGQFWMLLFLFLFGLYAYRKDWLIRGDIGSWKMWGMISLFFLFIFVLVVHKSFLPMVEEFLKVMEHNFLFSNKIPLPKSTNSFKSAYLIMNILTPMTCIFLLMFFLSFSKNFFDKPNKITAFCSTHSINVYILHFIPVVILQYSFMNISAAPIIKIILIIIIVIPSCLWLSHHLVYPYPRAAISFFVILKLVSLFLGFDFYYNALLALLFICFSGALYESVKLLMSFKSAHI
ncbi:MAG: acyltransferase family protein [Desulfamplus sp.]|nr:acyltransferase family protein [Desulfamplus sp.]